MDTACARRPIVDIGGTTRTGPQGPDDPTRPAFPRASTTAPRAAQATVRLRRGDDPRVLRARGYHRNGFRPGARVGREDYVKKKLEAEGLGDAVRELTVRQRGQPPISPRRPTRPFLFTNGLRAMGIRPPAGRAPARRPRPPCLRGADAGPRATRMAMVTGATRKSAHVLELINHGLDAAPHDGAVGVTAVAVRAADSCCIADTLSMNGPTERPRRHSSERGASGRAGPSGLVPRLAFFSFSTFGYPVSERQQRCTPPPGCSDERGGWISNHEGEMAVGRALNPRSAEGLSLSRAGRGPRTCAGGAGAAFGVDSFG